MDVNEKWVKERADELIKEFVRLKKVRMKAQQVLKQTEAKLIEVTGEINAINTVLKRLAQKPEKKPSKPSKKD